MTDAEVIARLNAKFYATCARLGIPVLGDALPRPAEAA